MGYGTYGVLIEEVTETGLKRTRRPQTKKELKEAVKQDPTKVLIENHGIVTDMGSPKVFFASELKRGTFASAIHGPDPHKSRKWIAKIERTADGKLLVT